jgi:hypothetical protein
VLRQLPKRSHAGLKSLFFWGSFAAALPALRNVLASLGFQVA